MDLTPPPLEPANIVDLRGNPVRSLEITRKEKAFKYCQARCTRILVDEEKRSIECRDCGQVLDAWDYLLSWAVKGDQRMQMLKSIEVEMKVKQAELQVLKNAIKRDKRVLKGANPSAPELARPWSLAHIAQTNPAS